MLDWSPQAPTLLTLSQPLSLLLPSAPPLQPHWPGRHSAAGTLAARRGSQDEKAFLPNLFEIHNISSPILTTSHITHCITTPFDNTSRRDLSFAEQVSLLLASCKSPLPSALPPDKARSLRPRKTTVSSCCRCRCHHCRSLAFLWYYTIPAHSQLFYLSIPASPFCGSLEYLKSRTSTSRRLVAIVLVAAKHSICPQRCKRVYISPRLSSQPPHSNKWPWVFVDHIKRLTLSHINRSTSILSIENINLILSRRIHQKQSPPWVSHSQRYSISYGGRRR